MKLYILSYIIAFIIFLAMDAVWLGFIARDFYQSNLAFLLKEKPDYLVALIFYAFYVVGLLIFGVYYGGELKTWTSALLYGALFGFFAYATYDLTSYSITKNFPLNVAIVDILWGSFISGTVAALTAFIIPKWVL